MFIGETEGIDDLPHLIELVNTGKMGVDWMLAYIELHRLVAALKEAAQNYEVSVSENFTGEENKSFSLLFLSLVASENQFNKFQVLLSDSLTCKCAHTNAHIYILLCCFEWTLLLPQCYFYSLFVYFFLCLMVFYSYI